MTPKEAHAYKEASLAEVDKAIESLEYELIKLYFMKRNMIAMGKSIFFPEDHGIEEYIPETGMK